MLQFFNVHDSMLAFSKIVGGTNGVSFFAENYYVGFDC